MSYYGNASNSSSGSGFYGTHNNTSYAAADVNSWQVNTAPLPQQQQQHYDARQESHQQGYSHQQQQKQQQQQQPGVWNPATAAVMANVAGSMMSGGGLNNDVVFDSISSAGQTFFRQGTARMIPGLESTVLLLRNYFAVDNRYVVRKMQKVLLPFLSKHWQRQVRSDEMRWEDIFLLALRFVLSLASCCRVSIRGPFSCAHLSRTHFGFLLSD